ncbi:C3a anaphylatoxin chemotactic receptor-like isoform X1 [Gopherus flavomarginatus]|uniref:C3a anaphylatoxin chemotactic receptor-like isoform X1 n=2 Tax=Gopherus flavomarginatus TaxID=286002 RepID=UPI0021CC4D78|nr:C3a anaphylatoxin chemotactic receptor-like isoform X1 [Gopherus flavomarginatus]
MVMGRELLENNTFISTNGEMRVQCGYMGRPTHFFPKICAKTCFNSLGCKSRIWSGLSESHWKVLKVFFMCWLLSLECHMPSSYRQTKRTCTEYLKTMSLFLSSNSTYKPDDGATLQYAPEIIGSLFIFILTFILGLLGNGLVIWVAGLKMKRTVNTVWFLHLAIADFLCCMSLPFSIIHLILHEYWPYGYFLCKVIPSAIILNMFASVFLLTAISIDRCLMVMKPVWCQNHRNVRLATVMCCCIWLLAFIMCCPAFLYRKTFKDEFGKTVCTYQFGDDRDYDYINYGNDSAMSSSISSDEYPGGFSSTDIPGILNNDTILLGNLNDYFSYSSQPTTLLAINITRIVFGFLLPFSIMAACYILIVIKMHRAQFTKPRGKTLRVILVVVVAFFVCWAPFHAVGALPLLAMPGTGFREAVALWDHLSIALAYVNSCINPLLYVFVGRDFRQKARQSVQGILEGAFSEEVTRSTSYSRDRTKTSADRDISSNTL